MFKEPNLNDLSHWPMGERVARLEQQARDADKALDLSRDSVSISTFISVLTLIISVIAILIVWLKH